MVVDAPACGPRSKLIGPNPLYGGKLGSKLYVIIDATGLPLAAVVV